jgi:hypothetical protein
MCTARWLVKCFCGGMQGMGTADEWMELLSRQTRKRRANIGDGSDTTDYHHKFYGPVWIRRTVAGGAKKIVLPLFWESVSRGRAVCLVPQLRFLPGPWPKPCSLVHATILIVRGYSLRRG